MSGIKDIAALDAKLRSMSIADRKALLNSAVTGLNNMVGERYDLGKRLLDRQQAGKQNLGKEFKAKGGIVGFANGDMVDFGQAPKYKIDPRYYDSPEYKQRQKEKQAGEIAGMAFTYSPYFGTAGSTAIRKDDQAYEAYVKRIGGNPAADYGTAAFGLTEDKPKTDAAPPPTGGKMEGVESKLEEFAKNVKRTDEQIFGPDGPGSMKFDDLQKMGRDIGITQSQLDDISRQDLIEILRGNKEKPALPVEEVLKQEETKKTTNELLEELLYGTGVKQEPEAQPEAQPESPPPSFKPVPYTEAQPTDDLPAQDPEKVSTVATTQPVDQTFDPNATTADVAAENIATTTATTTGTQPDPKDANINLGDIGEAALPVLGTAALDAVLGDGEVDWKQALTLGLGAGQALGLDLFDKLGAPAGGDPKAGYQGKIPTYAATRRQVPVDYATDRRPGSGGRRYFTDMRYTTPENAGIAATAAAQDALALQQMNQNNPLNQPPVRTQPVEQPMARGGYAYAPGGLAGMMPSRYLNSMADGMADSIPSSIDNKDPAALSGGEFVVAADVVSGLGNGNSNAGAQQLYNMMDRVRKARTGTTKQGKQIRPQSVMPV